MRARAARRIREGIRRGRADAALVAMFGNKPLGHKIEGMFLTGQLPTPGGVAGTAYWHTYNRARREQRITAGLERLLADIQSESETESGRHESAADAGGFADRDSDRGPGRGGTGPADSGRGDGRNLSDGDHGRDRTEKDSGLPDRQRRVANKTRDDNSLATSLNVHYTEHNGVKSEAPGTDIPRAPSRRTTDQGEMR